MKKMRLVCCFCLILVSLLAVGAPGIVLAQDEEEQPLKEFIELNPTYPTIESIAGGMFEFEVEFLYVGAEARIFDLRTTAPKGFEVYMTPPYEKEKKISSIRLEPSFAAGTKIRVVAVAPFWPLPEPGEYNITFEAISDELKATTELTAVITDIYKLVTVSSTGRYNTTAKTGQDNIFSINVGNLGTGAIDSIKFTPTKPDGWSVEFTPEKIDLLDALDEQTVEVNIKPAAKTIAGDYMISIRASGKQASAGEIDIRVTVESPTIWGWVGVVIILIVVIGLVVIFMRLSRR